MPPEQQQGGGVMGWIDMHPAILIAGVVFLALALGTLFIKNKNTSSSTATTTPTASGDLSGLQTDAQGNHIIYRDTSDSFYNYSDVQGSYNTTVGATTSNVTSTTNNGSPTPPPPVNSTTPPHSAPVPQPAPAPMPSKKGQWSCVYQVKGGDTLSAIAGRYGTDWHTLYTHNQGTIDSIAHAHGNPIPGGTWNNIFPGETLTVPCQ